MVLITHDGHSIRDGYSTSFRPLAGIMVLIRETRNLIALSSRDVSVPLRGLWFLSSSMFVFSSFITFVSVPLRGLWFLSTGTKITQSAQTATSFRPLAGIMVLIAEVKKIILDIVAEFPSPCGDYGSYRPWGFIVPTWNSLSFRPLAGIMVLIFVPGHVSFRVLPRFRPLAGIMVLIGFISVKDPVVGKTEGNYICM